MLEKHKTSLLMLTGALLFYVIFALVVPDVLYPSPESASRPIDHATAAVGQVLRSISPYLALALAVFAVLRFFREMGK